MDDHLHISRYRTHVALLTVVWLGVVALQWVSMFTVTDSDLCYRAWECVVAHGRAYPFSPHARYDRQSSGDLSHMAGLRRLQRHRRERFTVDEYGYRNPVGSLVRRMDAVVVGDSYAAGSYLSDDEILSGLLRKRSGLKVYNRAGTAVADYFRDPRFQRHPPRWLVLLQVERNFRQGFFGPPTSSPLLFARPMSPPDPTQKTRPPLDEEVARVREELERSHYLAHRLEPLYKGLLDLAGLYRFPPTIAHHDPASGFLFHADGLAPKLNTPRARRRARAAVAALRSYADAVRAQGTRLLVVVAPDKSTLYRERVPILADSDYVGALAYAQRLMRDAGVEHVDLLSLFMRERRAHPSRELYFADDTHMNAEANRLTYQAVAAYLRAASPP